MKKQTSTRSATPVVWRRTRGDVLEYTSFYKLEIGESETELLAHVRGLIW